MKKFNFPVLLRRFLLALILLVLHVAMTAQPVGTAGKISTKSFKIQEQRKIFFAVQQLP
jgi:hypothetical protein